MDPGFAFIVDGHGQGTARNRGEIDRIGWLADRQIERRGDDRRDH
jgi:hypothetical protein